ncbi:MAG: homogentisate 1,2-dioxygenase [Alphaproteobacteria bacterium]
MKNWIPLHKVEGTITRQAHTSLPDGTFEREMGKEGFFGPTTQIYHTRPPTSWQKCEGPMQPRAFDLTKFNSQHESPWDAPELLSNDSVKIRFWHCPGTMKHLARNADGDDLLFVHKGKGELFCDMGHMSFGEGEYILIPRSVMWRMECAEPLSVLMIEATNSSYKLPEKGLIGQHSLFDPAILGTPQIDEAFKRQQTAPGKKEEWKIKVKRRGQVSTLTYEYNPLDAVGWKGEIMPMRLNWRDIRPVMSHRYHLPPSAHTTFLADRFVVCTMVPRPIESDPTALKVPYFHNNDDYDEVLFVHSGQFLARDNFHPGMLSLNPSGVTHGPQPKAFETGANFARKETNEVVLMIDTRDALNSSSVAESVEVPNYADEWRKK